MTALSSAVARVARVAGVFGVAGLALLLVGCSPDEGDVASLTSEEGGGVVQGGYADENTASYAACLEDLGLSVHAITTGVLTGFVAIEGVRMLGDTDTSPIGIDGVDRDADVKGCRAKFPGAKDTLDTSIDVGAQAPSADDGVSEAGRAWAQCARDAGYAMIADPIVDLVVIPEELTLDQALALGATCSRPIAKPGDPAPHFDYQAGPDITPYLQAIESPIYADAMSGSSPSPGGGLPSDGSTATP